MSRYYEALQQASRLSGHTDGLHTIEGLDVLEMSGVAAPIPSTRTATFTPEAPADLASDPSSDLASSVSAMFHRQTEKVDPWLRFDPELREGTGRAREVEHQESVVLDRAVRVIPNCADPVVVEHYRRLRTKLVQQYATKPFRSLVIASPGPQEGKTVTAMNLALSFAMLPSFRVLVIDGDVRRGTFGKWLGVTDRQGFGDLIEGSATIHDAVFKCDSLPIHCILAGTSRTPPAELLHSPQLTATIRTLTGLFDLVIVDSPPINMVTDVQMLAGSCDAVLLVARAFSTRRKALEKAVQDLQPFRVIGTVLNGGARTQPYGGYGYY